MLAKGYIVDTGRRDIYIRHPGETRHADGISYNKMFTLCKAAHQLARCFGGKLNHNHFMALGVTQGDFTPFIQAAHIFPAILISVTIGGIKTSAINPESLESYVVPGLYFAGEMLEVYGDLGGFNFQWAWASGMLAGRTLGN